jgi:hypothetical protein
VDLLAARAPKGVDLHPGRLVGDTDPGVADPRPAPLFSKPFKRLTFWNRAIKNSSEKRNGSDKSLRFNSPSDHQKRSF